MALWQTDQELFDLIRRELFTAVVGDVMDTLVLEHQFLPSPLRPLHDDMIVLDDESVLPSGLTSIRRASSTAPAS